MIRCTGVTKRYKGRTAVSSIDLQIPDGICALLGPNGAGKSTLLRLIAGLEVPDEGSIQIAHLDGRQNSASIKQIMGVLPEHLGLFESLTLRENLQCTGPVYGLTMTESASRTDSLISLLHLQAGQHTHASQCSYGMRKKTAFAMALLHNPRVLLLDEPFEGIDPASSLVIENLLRRCADRGTTILLTSHLLPTVERLASRAIILCEGTIAWDSAKHQEADSLALIYNDRVGRPAAEELAWLGS